MRGHRLRLGARVRGVIVSVGFFPQALIRGAILRLTRARRESFRSAAGWRLLFLDKYK